MRHLSITLTLILSAILPLSCSKQDGVSRIDVFSQDGTRLSTQFIAPVEGGDFTLTVKTVADLDIFYTEASGSESEWFKLQDVIKTGTGEYRVNFTIRPLEGTLELRNGTLSFSAPSACLGKFLDVRQGYVKIYQENFSSQDGKVLALAPGESWQSNILTGLSLIKNAWISFQARTESSDGYSTLEVMLTGGATFPEIARNVRMTDIAYAAEFDNTCFYPLHIYNAGKVFSSETKICLTAPSDAESVIYIDNLTIYEIPVASGINGDDDEEQESEE